MPCALSSQKQMATISQTGKEKPVEWASTTKIPFALSPQLGPQIAVKVVFLTDLVWIIPLGHARLTM